MSFTDDAAEMCRRAIERFGEDVTVRKVVVGAVDAATGRALENHTDVVCKAQRARESDGRVGGGKAIEAKCTFTVMVDDVASLTNLDNCGRVIDELGVEWQIYESPVRSSGKVRDLMCSRKV